MKQLVVGILAHVDSGKTTLSEGMLYCTGKIHKLGRVDRKDTLLDMYELERERGITIFSKQAMLEIRKDEFVIALLDTPGHVDFSAEMERTLQVLDYAILVVSGLEGIQSHTETLWQLLRRYNIPTFIFVNKMDITKLSQEELHQQLHEKFGQGCVDFSDTEDVLYEQAALCQEDLLEQYLENGEISAESLCKAIRSRDVFPCYYGSARNLDGVEQLLDGLDRFTAMPDYPDELGLQVFKIAEDPQGNRLTYVKVTGGILQVRSQITYPTEQGEITEKISQIRQYSGSKFVPLNQVEAGGICAVTGLSQVQTGISIGSSQAALQPMLEPVMTYRVVLPPDVDAVTGLERLRKLEAEDPQLHVIWNSRLGELQVQLMGTVQQEVLSRMIAERFQMQVDFDHGSIAYKETIAAPVEGVGHYEPLRHYAEVHLLLEPLPTGSGLRFRSNCREEELDKNWQRLVMTHLQEKNHIGVLTGSPITDMRISLLTGKAHIKHTEGGDFRQATYRAVRQGLMSAKSVLLEPWYRFTLRIPAAQVGRAMFDLQQMNAEFTMPSNDGEISEITGRCPVSEMRGYAAEVVAYTQGTGRLNCMPDGYAPCHNTEEVIEEIGYDFNRDVENSGDSVFCSHGAGFPVKWDEVPQYMHLPYRWQAGGHAMDEEAIAAEAARQRQSYRSSSYGGSLAEDKELLAIYERTYGKVQRKERYALYTERDFESPVDTPARKQEKITQIPTGPEYLLVDGYNIIFAWDELKKIAAESLENARHELIRQLCNYQGVKQCMLIVVFDAYRVKGGMGSDEQVENIHVVYTKEAETADSYIERVTHQLSKEHRVRVATSDQLEQIIILGNGACRMSATEFLAEVQATEHQIREYITMGNLRSAAVSKGNFFQLQEQKQQKKTKEDKKA